MIEIRKCINLSLATWILFKPVDMFKYYATEWQNTLFEIQGV